MLHVTSMQVYEFKVWVRDLSDRCVACESVSSEHELKTCRPGEGVLAERHAVHLSNCSLRGTLST